MLGIRHFKGTAIDLFQGDMTSFVCDGLVRSVETKLKFEAPTEQTSPAARPEETVAWLTEPGSSAASKDLFVSIRVVERSIQDLAALIREAHLEAFKLASERKLRHISISPLFLEQKALTLSSTADIAVQAIRDFCCVQPGALRRVSFVLADRDSYKIYQQALFSIFPENEGDRN